MRHGPHRDARSRYTVRFYVIAMFFIVFDIEAIFLYPWAVVFKPLVWFGFWEMLVLSASWWWAWLRLGQGRPGVGMIKDGFRLAVFQFSVNEEGNQPASKPKTKNKNEKRFFGAWNGIEEQLGYNFLTTTLEKLVDWGRKNSLWPATFGLACCAIEMICTAANRYDIARLGWRPSGPRPARPT